VTTLIVIAKETIPGKVKTRLHPPLSYEEAAEVAAAAIQDTLAAASAVDVDRRILYFDGNLFPPGSEDYEVVPQGTGDLDVRLAHIFDHCTGPTVLIGMDTPQLDAQVLRDMFARWAAEDEDEATDAVTTDVFFGFANDGGFWTLGMREPDGSLIRAHVTGRHRPRATRPPRSGRPQREPRPGTRRRRHHRRRAHRGDHRPAHAFRRNPAPHRGHYLRHRRRSPP
jgi:glycosyltransferase A (GT-A) superfamily protein (DUF2064 family)